MSNETFTLADLRAFLRSRKAGAAQKNALRVANPKAQYPSQIVRPVQPGVYSAMIRLYHVTRDAAFRSMVDHIHRTATAARFGKVARSADVFASKMADDRVTPYLQYRLKLDVPATYFSESPKFWATFRKSLINLGYAHMGVTNSAARIAAKVDVAAKRKTKALISEVCTELKIAGQQAA